MDTQVGKSQEENLAVSEAIIMISIGLMLFGLIIWAACYWLGASDGFSHRVAAFAAGLVQGSFISGAIGFLIKIPAILRWIDRT